MYRELEKNFVQYKDLLKINKYNPQTDKEKLVAVPFGEYLPSFNEMQSLTPKPLVRESVYKKLLDAQSIIRKVNPEWELVVTDGFRDLAIQTRKHNQQLEKFRKIYKNESQAKAHAHFWIAAPEVASHPTGGAVDVMIRGLDYGAYIYNFTTKKQYVFSPEIDRDSAAFKNRMFLRDVMMSLGFAPFDGEWWHFSYGDKEWAVYYGKDEYLYNQRNFIH